MLAKFMVRHKEKLLNRLFHKDNYDRCGSKSCNDVQT